jgi:hypothetical protein
LIADECVYGAIVFRNRIRDKDKDPSFSAKQPRVTDERLSNAPKTVTLPENVLIAIDSWGRSRLLALRLHHESLRRESR